MADFLLGIALGIIFRLGWEDGIRPDMFGF